MEGLPTSFVISWMIAINVALLVGCQAQKQPAATTGSPSAIVGNSGFHASMMESMARMDREMMAAPMTGDPDHDFATMMIPHHQGAVDMARAYLRQAKNPALHRLAEEIIAEQPQEIETMRRRLVFARAASDQTALKTNNVGEKNEFAPAMMQSMEKMDQDMKAAPMTGQPDHDFAVMMIPHHQGAVDMAKPFLLYGKDPVLRRLASEIVVAQDQEIEVMRRQVAIEDGAAITTQIR